MNCIHITNLYLNNVEAFWLSGGNLLFDSLIAEVVTIMHKLNSTVNKIKKKAGARECLALS